MASFQSRLAARLSPRARTWLRSVTRGLPIPRWGNLRRTEPFSTQFGFDRGTPIDRYYLHRFLERHRADITGRVLEIQMPAYTGRFGHDVSTADSVDITDAANPALTYKVDLALAGTVIPDGSYDCFLLPNTLSFLRDLEGCLRQALRIVRPGGVILASASGFVPLVPDMPDYWRLSGDGWREVAGRVWPGCEVEVHEHGNCLAAAAAAMGLAVEELTLAELDVQDRRYPVLVTLRCRKPL